MNVAVDGAAGAGDPAHHRADGNGQRFGGIAIAHAIQHHERQQGALLVGQGGHGCLCTGQVRAALNHLAPVITGQRGGMIHVHLATARTDAARLVDVQVLGDAIHPAVQSCSLDELVSPRQGPFDSGLAQVIGRILVTRQRKAKAPQPRQDADDVPAQVGRWGCIAAFHFSP